MKIFLTGSTGFVGGHVARALADQGGDLRLLVRKASKLDSLQGIRAETHLGDLAEPESLRSGLAGCEALVHVAADYRLWIPDPEAMYRVNVDGTRALLRLAREAGVKRVVYTSSVATLRFHTDGRNSDEDTPTRLDDMVGHYKRSKFLAEQEALSAARAGQAVVVLNPSAPVGPGDAKPTPTGRILVDFLNGRFPAYMDTGLNLVDVREVARAHAAALTRGEAGRRYVLGGENLTLKQILDALSALSGRPSPRLRVPYAAALAYAGFEEWFSGRLLKREPRATLEEVRMGKKKMYVSSERARRELGFNILPAAPALEAAVAWFRERGYAPKA
ncbi:MAG TPA: hopanoid-associated sugar epimerase [bacterium]|jgi:dihydroflavonol-4-reductase|nr:hopanoid-associated sugar epimerase [bacterium]